ncbi:DUF1549 domain-containing protein [Babesia caballi]|uniref:DUF1549 domain-containing protein n=1 Tax=Babesia caballi TaxID=5871 RepID=A0AAV4M1E1_BABCB|nr:DUF1549 domain-containing protein [Babesia caballi]
MSVLIPPTFKKYNAAHPPPSTAAPPVAPPMVMVDCVLFTLASLTILVVELLDPPDAPSWLWSPHDTPLEQLGEEIAPEGPSVLEPEFGRLVLVTCVVCSVSRSTPLSVSRVVALGSAPDELEEILGLSVAGSGSGTCGCSPDTGGDGWFSCVDCLWVPTIFSSVGATAVLDASSCCAR